MKDVSEASEMIIFQRWLAKLPRQINEALFCIECSAFFHGPFQALLFISRVYTFSFYYPLILSSAQNLYCFLFFRAYYSLDNGIA